MVKKIPHIEIKNPNKPWSTCDGIDGYTTFKDSSASAHNESCEGIVEEIRIPKKILIKSYEKIVDEFNGYGDYLTIALPDGFKFSKGDFSTGRHPRMESIGGDELKKKKKKGGKKCGE